jgi:hypothetical protein
MLPFSFKGSRQANPLQVPQRGPYEEQYPLTGHFYLSLNICVFIFPSESSVREPPPCSLTGSPRAAILRHQSHWSTIHSFIRVFIHLCHRPELGADSSVPPTGGFLKMRGTMPTFSRIFFHSAILKHVGIFSRMLI